MTILEKTIQYLASFNETEQYAKTLLDLSNAKTDAEVAAISAKLIAEIFSGAVITPTLRVSMPLVRLGLAVSGQMWKWEAISKAAGLFGGDLVGSFIDWVNSRHPGAALFDIIHPGVSITFNAAERFILRHDPLTFDLDGDGLETVGTSAGVLFDHDADGVLNGTGWVAPDDAFLVRDLNGNGTIDNGRELFGDNTLKSNGQMASDGFDALSDLDSNADGQISSADTAYNSLRLWRDLNQDGITQSGELYTLSSQGIASINVTKTQNSQLLPNGNQIADLGSFTRTDGSTGTTGTTSTLGDINLAADTFHRQFPDHLDTTAVATLPDMQGSGLLRDLREVANDSEWRVMA